MERWKKVKGFEAYEVSNLGRVRRTTKAQGGYQGGSATYAGRLLKTRDDGQGYLCVALYNNRKRVDRKVHRLVAQAFISNPLNLPEVNHRGEKSDNRAKKLEWRSMLGHHRDQMQRGQKGDGITYRKDVKYRKFQAMYNPEPKVKRSLGFFLTKKEAKTARDAAVKSLPRLE